MYLRTLKAARSAKKFWEEIFMPKSQLGGILYIFPPGPRGGCLYFPLKHKSAMYTFVQQRGGGSRRDPNHKSMYKCAYMYVHLSLSPPPTDSRYSLLSSAVVLSSLALMGLILYGNNQYLNRENIFIP